MAKRMNDMKYKAVNNEKDKFEEKQLKDSDKENQKSIDKHNKINTSFLLYRFYRAKFNKNIKWVIEFENLGKKILLFKL